MIFIPCSCTLKRLCIKLCFHLDVDQVFIDAYVHIIFFYLFAIVTYLPESTLCKIMHRHSMYYVFVRFVKSFHLQISPSLFSHVVNNDSLSTNKYIVAEGKALMHAVTILEKSQKCYRDVANVTLKYN